MKNYKSYTPAELIGTIIQNGDVVIDYINRAGKLRYAVVTLDMDKYVLPFFEGRNIEAIVTDDNCVIVFSWDANKPIRIPCDKVVRITPLSKVLNNGT